MVSGLGDGIDATRKGGLVEDSPDDYGDVEGRD